MSAITAAIAGGAPLLSGSDKPAAVNDGTAFVRGLRSKLCCLCDMLVSISRPSPVRGHSSAAGAQNTRHIQLHELCVGFRCSNALKN